MNTALERLDDYEGKTAIMDPRADETAQHEWDPKARAKSL
jgi:hypothetical protein